MPCSLRMLLTFIVLLCSLGISVSSPPPQGNAAPDHRKLDPILPSPTLPPRDPRVLILGAGIAGLSAAATLHDAGVTDFLILEQSDRLGGRILDQTFGSERIEVGANWIEGMGPVSDNPIWQLAQRIGLKGALTHQLADRGFEPALYSTNGTRVSSADATALYAEFATVMDRVTTLCCRRLKAGSPDMTLREALTFSKWPEPEQQSPMQRAVEYFAVDWDFTVGAERVSLFSFASNQCDASNSKLMIAEPARFFVSDERGFAAVARALAAPFADRVLFGANVTRIDSARGRVELADGRAFTSPYVLCTFSSGVVNRAIAASSSPAASADLVFTTALPAWKIDAFASMPMGNYVKVFFRFPFIFWDRSLDYSLYAGTSPAGNFTVWQNLEAADGRFFPAAAGLLMATLVGTAADNAEAMSEATVAAAGMRVLRDMFADRAVPDPIAVTVPKWRASPAFRGAYSNAAIGANASVFDALAMPVGNLYFAGEATDPDYNGFVEGAFFSGRRAAKQMLARIHPGSFIDGLTIGTLIAAFLTLIGVGACAWHCRQRAAARAAVAAGDMTSAEAAGVDLAVEFGLDVPLDHLSDFESKRDRIEISPPRSPRHESSGQHATHSIASAMVSEALVANASRGNENEADADSEKVELGLLHAHPSRHEDNDDAEYL